MMTSISAQETSSTGWTDSKFWLWLFSPFVPILACAFIAAGAFMNMPLLLWATPLLFYLVGPVADRLIGSDPSNPPEDIVETLEARVYYRAIVIAFIPAQYAVTILGAWASVNAGLPWWALVGLLFTVGEINGFGINTAHELGHKKDALERWLAKVALAPAVYGHFYVEHNRGHHKNVATPLDPASARMGESFWAFLPRTVIGGVRSAWKLEKDRLSRRGQLVWSLENDNLQAWALSLVLFATLVIAFGWAVLPFLILQAVFGIAGLEVVNYIEHYGLLRQYDEKTGRYERCRPAHSWNSNMIMTNVALYQLQRHSDHHAHPTRRYQALRHFEEAPQLPAGYISMTMLAFVPPLWFARMDPLVVHHYGGDLRRAHIHAPARRRLMRKWQTEEASASGTARPVPVGALVDGEATPPQSKDASRRHQCPNCGYIFDEAVGCAQQGFPPGTKWQDIPDDWACPDCAVRDKRDFRLID